MENSKENQLTRTHGSEAESKEVNGFYKTDPNNTLLTLNNIND